MNDTTTTTRQHLREALADPWCRTLLLLRAAEQALWALHDALDDDSALFAASTPQGARDWFLSDLGGVAFNLNTGAAIVSSIMPGRPSRAFLRCEEADFDLIALLEQLASEADHDPDSITPDLVCAS